MRRRWLDGHRPSERGNDVLVELRPCAGNQTVEGDGWVHPTPIGAVGGHRIKGVGDREDTGIE